MTDERFDEIVFEMRDEAVSPEQSAAARDRVWQKIAALPTVACAGFREEFGAFLSGTLSESRRLLIDDHLSRCTDCRRALAELRDGAESKVIAMPTRRSKMPVWTRWAIAAGIGALALYAGRDAMDRALAPGGARATVISVSGALYTLPQNSLQAGASLAEGDVVRTTAGSRAVLQLADGSRVEMNQRTELFIRAAWSGETIVLDRGDVIVEAAKQRRGSLRVVTRDSIASVKGTVFGVSSGAAGSVVAVVEGSVAVQHGGLNQTLKPGQTAASNDALRPVQVRDSVSWSRDAAKYSTLLGEVSEIEKQVANAIPPPRTQADLLRYLPADTVLYVAIPNLDGAIRQALYQFDQRARSNAVLGEWWSSEHGQMVRERLDRMQSVTPLLGDEVVFLISNLGNGDRSLLLSRVRSGRESALRQALDQLGAGGEKIPYRINQDLLMVGGSDLAAYAARLGTGASSPFAAEIARRYQSGVGFLAAVDMGAVGQERRTETRMIGLTNMRYLFFEQRSGNQGDANEVTLSFNGARTGIASWLAPAGSAGSAEYVSPDAVLVFSASTKDPRQAFDELIGLFQDGKLSDAVRKFEAETGVNLGTDLAGTLGTDFTVAIERPTIPIPGWMIAYEVVRPGVLDDTIRRLVDAFNRHLPAERAAQKLVFTQEYLNGRSWNSLKSEAAAGLTLHWTYDRGYLVASTDRALAANAIAIRDSGASLVRSVNFQSHFPASSGMHHSGLVWVNTSGAIADAASLLPIDNVAIKTVLGSREPLLIVLDGEMERIHASSRNRLTSMLLDMVVAHQPVPRSGPGDRDKMEKPALKAR